MIGDCFEHESSHGTFALVLQVKIEKPILRIPMLAIHLNRDILSEGFKLNKQTHLLPVLATAVQQAVNKNAAGANGGSEASKKRKADDLAKDLPKTLQVRLVLAMSAVMHAHMSCPHQCC